MANKHLTVKQAGKLGGEARARNLTKEQRIEIARKGYYASPLSIKRANNHEIDQNTSKEGI